MNAHEEIRKLKMAVFCTALLSVIAFVALTVAVLFLMKMGAEEWQALADLQMQLNALKK